MKITIPNYKYKVGSNLGIAALDDNGIVDKLNSIIDWDESIFPPDLEATPEEKEVPIQEDGETRGCWEAIATAKAQGMSDDDIETSVIPQLEEQTGKKITRTDDGKWWKMMAKVYPENREYLGIPPRLKPGNCFKYDGQVIAIDEDPETKKERLVLYSTDSGPKALERLNKEVIDPEYTLRNPSPLSIFELNITNTEMIPIDEFYFFQGGDQRLGDLFDEDRDDDVLSNPWVEVRLNPYIWRYLLKYFPKLKESLENNIMEITCEPNFESITMYVDKKGTLIYNFADLEEEEFDMIFPCFWNGLWEYLKIIL